jgi:Uma2 family endonuclease
MTTTLSPATAPLSEGPAVLHDVSWEFYEQALREVGDQHIFLTYDRGELEIMAPSSYHEIYKKLIARFIEILTLELDIPIASAGSTTFRRKDLKRGLEPDECYYVQNEARMRRPRGKLDLKRDPAPDLVIEMEYTRHTIDRLGIYAALRVPEVWRYDLSRLTVMLLQKDGSYAESENSAAFPFLPMADFARFLARQGSTDETTLVREFRDWVRANLRA